MALSFTARATGILRVLNSQAWIGPAFIASGAVGPTALKSYLAIWDTGATGTVVSQNVIDQLGLKPVGMTVASGIQGDHNTEVYLICVGLPNGVGFPSIKATRGIIRGADVLIGMDIITRGDFAITHQNGKTCFSFRCPSCETIDFVSASKPPSPAGASPKVGRNDRCPCGSGKKYKKCCLNKSQH